MSTFMALVVDTNTINGYTTYIDSEQHFRPHRPHRKAPTMTPPTRTSTVRTLSPAMSRVIDAMRDGATLSHLTHGSPALFQRGKYTGVYEATVRALKERGLISLDYADYRSSEYSLTDAGRAAATPVTSDLAAASDDVLVSEGTEAPPLVQIGEYHEARMLHAETKPSRMFATLLGCAVKVNERAADQHPGDVGMMGVAVDFNFYSNGVVEYVVEFGAPGSWDWYLADQLDAIPYDTSEAQ